MPRPPILDAVKKGQVVALISTGLSYTQAAQFVECAVSTIRYCAQRDPEFQRQLDLAAVKSQLELLALMRKHAARSWRAAAWLLERLYPHQYGPRKPDSLSREELSRGINQVMRVVETIDNEPVRRDVHRRLRRIADALDSWSAEHSLPWEGNDVPGPADCHEADPGVAAGRREMDMDNPHSPRRRRLRKRKQRDRAFRKAKRWSERGSKHPNSIANPANWKHIDPERRRELGIKDSDLPADDDPLGGPCDGGGRDGPNHGGGDDGPGDGGKPPP
jgi:hypothetical protein